MPSHTWCVFIVDNDDAVLEHVIFTSCERNDFHNGMTLSQFWDAVTDERVPLYTDGDVYRMLYTRFAKYIEYDDNGEVFNGYKFYVYPTLT